jgi:D-alanyl-D-alanine carboxypeptidase
MRLSITVLALVLLAATPKAFTTQMAAHIDAAARGALTRQHVAAISLAIVENGRIVYARGYGLRDVSHGEKADANTVYPIGSNTKQFTAAAVLLLQQQGRLRIGDRLAKYVPDASHAAEVTLEELLAQTSGLPDYTQTQTYSEQFSKHVTPQDVLSTLRGLPLAFKPGTDWQYSNTNYLLLAMVIFKASGESYRSFVRKHFFAALHLTTAAFDRRNVTYPDQARGYTSFATGALTGPRHEAYSWFVGASDIMMSARDLARWDIALTSGKAVSRSSFAAMSTSKLLTNGKPTSYGYGLGAGKTFLGHSLVGHLGGLAGFVSEDLMIPSDRVSVVLLGNGDNFNPVPIAHDVVATLYGQTLPHQRANVLPETTAEAAQARRWLRRALSGGIEPAQETPDFIAAMAPTPSLEQSMLRDLRALGARLGHPGAMQLISREGPPGVHAFAYLVTFSRDVVKVRLCALGGREARLSERFSLLRLLSRDRKLAREEAIDVGADRFGEKFVDSGKGLPDLQRMPFGSLQIHRGFGKLET